MLAVLLLALGLGARPYFAAKSAGELTVSIAIDGETVRTRPPLVFDVAGEPLWLLAPGRAP